MLNGNAGRVVGKCEGAALPGIVGIVGYKNSGKTTLTRALARELIGRGYDVAVIKHTHHSIDMAGKDTTIFGESVGQVALVSLHESALFWKRPLSVDEIVSHIEADVVLVEGFKREVSFPKIACLRGEPDDRDLFVGRIICAVGSRALDVRVASEIPFLDRDDVSGITDLVELELKGV